MWTEACTLIERAERLHRQFFQPSPAGAQQAGWEPPLDIFETEHELWIVAALPGVEPHDLQISLKADELVVAGLRRLPAIARGAAIHRMELPHGRFERRIRLSTAGLQVGRSELVGGCLFLSLTKQP
jgi:HSP20 family molecular chaperone IbpA